MGIADANCPKITAACYALVLLQTCPGEPTEEELDTWFNTGADDVAGPAVRATRATRRLKWYMGRISVIVGDAGIAVGTKLSLADVLIYHAFAEYLPREQVRSPKINKRLSGL